MAQGIRVLIVDDIPETREHLTKLLGFESDVEVVGAAASGPEALEMGPRLRPDVILMDINMPGMDGIAATEQLTVRLPTCAIVMMSVQGEADYLRRSMLAGAREFLVKPFSSDELVSSIRQVHAREKEKASRLPPSSATVASGPPRERGQIVTVFSPKGGVGRTTIAVNVAVAARQLGRSVALVDASFQFGDVGILLNLPPQSKSIADLVPEMAAGDPESLDQVLVRHASGVDVLLAPPSPEMAELITTPYLKRVLERLRENHDLVVVDAWPWFHETTLALLDLSDEILAVLTLEITAIKNMRLFLDVASQLGYPGDRIKLVLNRADSAIGIRAADAEHSIGRKIDETIVSDGRIVVFALNRGIPFVLGSPAAAVSQDVVRLARSLVGAATAEAEPAKPAGRKPLFARR